MSLQRSLFRKYLSVLTAAICGTLLVASIVQLALNVREQRQSAEALLVAKSRLASMQIQSFLAPIVASMTWALDYDQPGVAVDTGQIRDESHRLLRKVPSIWQVRYIDGAACVRLEVSRVGVDREGDCGALPLSARETALLARAHAQQLAYGPVLFREASEPYIEIAMAARGRRGGALLVQVDLRQIHATISAIQVGDTGYAYLIDRDRQLLAHPDNSLVLRHIDLHPSPVIAAVLRSGATPATAMVRDMDGQYVLTTASAVAGPEWQVFVQLPVREAFGSIFTALWLTLFVTAGAMVCATAASYFLARRMAQPILEVRNGAVQMAGGDLETRIVVSTGDEIELLAHEFNRMAAALGASYAQLEEKVRQRTHALEQAGAQLRHQADELALLNGELSVRLGELAVRNDEAERASAAKTRFLAAASHDLLQPMHAVGLLVGILRQRIRYPEVSLLVMKVEATVQGMQTLFGSLLDISKLDSNAVKVDLQTVDIQNLFNFIELNYQPIAQEKGIVLRLARCRCAVRTDPALLERILGNLVSNALRYTETGKVLVGCRRVGEAIRMQVYDTGIGIPAEYQSHIFEEFYQIERPEKRHGGGLGLGLSIVRRSAALLGLPLDLRSTPGVGSVFGITLPLAHPDTPRASLPANAGAQQDGLRGAFIVLLDDDRDACEAAEQLLRSAGCHVVAATSSAAARALLADHLRTPDLIVTDLRLGAGDSGWQAIAGIRADAGHLIPALIITGEARTPLFDALPEHCELVRKPIGPGRLFELCARLLNAPSTSQSSAPACLPQ
ncbi:HAMP domain-containing protein [Duganella sp. BJB1802]|uniref:ATP-binding protein n=1 Tax=Duganella sp. BJB1802 TaxID=2744575 RepID=UPI001594D79E|nr:ATP-binding protein [Duganella sp. BJB1802]NVD74774.1 HAMP domain-containing protein [Duganella sp. BJB1802]